MRWYEIRVDGEFSAAHQLRLYDGTLEPLHGHNWKVELTLRSAKLDSMGVVADFNVVRATLNAALARWHDRFLNEMAEFQTRNPSAEHVAEVLFERMRAELPAGPEMVSVRVWETSGCAAACVESEARR